MWPSPQHGASTTTAPGGLRQPSVLASNRWGPFRCIARSPAAGAFCAIDSCLRSLPGLGPSGLKPVAQAIPSWTSERPFFANTTTRPSSEPLACVASVGFAQDAGDLTSAWTPAEALTNFPDCQCNDYKCRASPYRLRLSSVAPAGGGLTKICYKTEMVRGGGEMACMVDVSGWDGHAHSPWADAAGGRSIVCVDCVVSHGRHACN